MPPTLGFDDGLEYLVSQCRAFIYGEPEDSKLLIAIAGGSASGKSFLAEKLQKKLAPLNSAATVLALDDYFRDLNDPELPRTDDGRLCFDAPESYHEKEFKDDVMALLRGEPRQIPQYDKGPMKRVGNRPAAYPEKIIIAEGLFAVRFLHWMPRLVPQSILLKVYMDADEAVRQNRRVKKAVEHYGVAKEKAESVFKNIVLPYHLRYVEPQKYLCELIIRGDRGGNG